MKYIRAAICLVLGVGIAIFFFSLANQVHISIFETSLAAKQWYITLAAIGAPLVLGVTGAIESLESWGDFWEALLHLLLSAVLSICVVFIIFIILIIIDIVRHIASDPFLSAIGIVLCVGALVPPAGVICIIAER